MCKVYYSHIVCYLKYYILKASQMCAACNFVCYQMYFVPYDRNILYGNILSKYVWDEGLFSIFDIKAEYNYLAVNLFIETVLVFRIIWWSLIVRELLLLIIFWTIFFHALVQHWLVVTIENKICNLSFISLQIQTNY